VDWDSDGKKDLIIGEADGSVRIYLNQGTGSSPLFDEYTLLMVDGVAFNCSHFATPYVVDWNNDGKNDVICGNLAGTIYLLINEGTKPAPYFESAVLLRKGEEIFQTAIRNTPVAADWNRDGKKDLLVGACHGLIEFYENIGTDRNPAFDDFTYLEIGPSQWLDVGAYSRLDVADWDEDGEIDIISGDADGFVHLFRAIGPLSVDKNFIPSSTGGSIEFALAAGSIQAGRHFFLMGTEAGTEPGTPLPGGALLPLNWGMLSWYVFNNHNTYPLTNFRGVLDSSGQAMATLNAPPVPLAAGAILHFAFTTEWPYDFQSKPLAVEVSEVSFPE